MSNMSTGKIAGGILGIAAIALIAAYMGGLLGGGPGGNGQAPGQSADVGIDISNTDCDGIAAARAAVDAELEQRKTKAGEQFATDMETASDNYFVKRRQLSAARDACTTTALLADPCKDLFERSSALAQAILNTIDDGFDQAKFDEREQVKKEYDECLKNPPEDATYDGKKSKCDADFQAGDEQAQLDRTAEEDAAKSTRDAAIITAETEHRQKMATLDAIEEACKEPPPSTAVSIGGISSGTTFETGNPACTGTFAGYDPETQAKISNLKSLREQAKAAGKLEGWGGSIQLGAKISELEAEMAQGPRKCTQDSDCGDVTPVCCSSTTIGKVMCSDGVCANEITQCEENEVCSGKPAQCVAPASGAQSDAISISRTINIAEPCNNTIQVLNLQKRDANSNRFEITGNIPNWLSFTPPGGSLPSDVNVVADCAKLKGKGPGNYTASGTIQVFDDDDNLINTIPFTIAITVEGSQVDINVNTNTGTTGTDSTAVSVAPRNVSFTYDHSNPVCPLSAGSINIAGPAGSEWTLHGELPIWLQLPNGTSGTVPATIPMQFPCLLDEYKNQTQTANIPFMVNTPDGERHELIILVTANITKFEE